MATHTDNYALVKSTYGELADVAVINGNMDTIDGIMHSNRTMLAPAFSQTEDYAVGDVVVYEGNLYRFIVPHTAGNWYGTDVEQTTLGEEVSTKGGADVTKTASGNPIEITDGASAPLVKCVTAIQGNQDLHGYDKPWVGGAGKNKLPNNLTGKTENGITFTVNSDGTVVATGTATGRVSLSAVVNVDKDLVDGTSYILSGCPVGGSNTTFQVATFSTPSYNTQAKDLGNEVTFQYVKTSGDNFVVALYIEGGYTCPSGGLVFKPMIRLASVTDPTYEPYSNICPISGYSSVRVNVSNGGVDVYDSDGTEGNNSNSLIEIISKDSFRVYNTRNQTYASSKQNISVYNLVVGKTYTIEADVTISSGVGLLSVRNSSSQVLTPLSLITQNGHYKVTFVATAEMSKLSFFCTYDTSTTGDVTYSNIRLYEGSELKEYTISLGDTYYSGQIDVVRGVFVVDKASKIFNGDSDEDWKTTTTSAGRSFYIAVSDAKAGQYYDENMKCNSWSITNQTSSKKDCCYITSSGNLQVISGETLGITTVADWKTWLSNNELQVCYELATPIEISLTPTIISSLLGTNTMWTDGDNLEIEYITEEFQPLVDLIQSSKHVYSTAEQIVGTWVDGSTVYEKVYLLSTQLVISNNNWTDSGISKSGLDLIIGAFGIDTNDKSKYELNGYLGGSGSEIQLQACRATSSAYINILVIRYTKSTPTRSLNLTKSAVEEIPDEIKNAEYEEKPDVNEADDDAPTEEQER